ncbi:TPA: LysR substrate-binding domain-containing protein [Klebsiella pneumoniae]|uniref:LysR substrate-binding domain-containing protein n=1 Tax=Klebsiella pneumoniae TaxID=573 RepID=UPI000D597577|nr:LysR substrate-binding domain-containing protein [Klebsiella pneumoniae]HDS2725767.1 LysR family transcriptional regulator [Klebsiella pneumoniae subsp. pneumoniae]MBK3179220.1 LysR family transcriptional regulator [Klebsiella pneumoniae]MCJ6030257.1 LysR substrate-binding domain-containing protein [Klebsiella pneumoniae]HBQ8836576.1 LysR family transcriptional regulator [Klebsiella pneumoniae]HBR2523896.1 LysR family transcriptional regulator [Klebsiella pneumoniae]
MADFPPVASLRSFEAVARLGSVTQAAHEMSVTHSAVSQHIKQLEALVGVTLFIRHGRGVRITEEGRLYALQIREALQHIADATRMVQIKPRTLEVTLATLPSFGCHWLLPRLARFQTRHPQIAVRLLTSLAVVNLQQEGIDLAIRMGQGDWEGMESRHLFADEQLVVAAASDIIFSMESWNAWCSQAGLEKPIVPSGLRLNDSNLVLEAVRLGAGVALERRSLVAGAIARGELVQLTAVTVPYPWHYWLTVSPQAENRPEVARFIAWLEEEIALWRQQISA